MKAAAAGIEETAIRQQCRLLRVPTIGAQFRRLAEEALQQKQTHVRYLEALLAAELEDQEQRVVQRRIWDARLPRVKTLEQFDFAQAPQISANRVRELAEGGYPERAEKAAVILTTNLPFSEGTQVFPNPRLCKALLDRLTDRAHIIETGTESYRFRRTLEGRQKRKN